MAGVVRDANSKGDLDNAVKKQGSLVVVHFWASWCEPSKAMEPVFTQIAIETPNAQFFRVRGSAAHLFFHYAFIACNSVFSMAGEVFCPMSKWARSEQNYHGSSCIDMCKCVNADCE